MKCAPVRRPWRPERHVERAVFDVHAAVLQEAPRRGSSDRRRRRTRTCPPGPAFSATLFGLDARRRCRRGRKSAAAADCRSRVLATMPLPMPGPHCTVGTTVFPPCVTVAEKSMTYGDWSEKANFFRALQTAGVLVFECQRRTARCHLDAIGARFEERLASVALVARIRHRKRERSWRAGGHVVRNELERLAVRALVFLQPPALQRSAARREYRVDRLVLDLDFAFCGIRDQRCRRTGLGTLGRGWRRRRRARRSRRWGTACRRWRVRRLRSSTAERDSPALAVATSPGSAYSTTNDRTTARRTRFSMNFLTSEARVRALAPGRSRARRAGGSGQGASSRQHRAPHHAEPHHRLACVLRARRHEPA